MTYSTVNELIASAEAAGHENFREYDGEIFMLFYNRFKDTPFEDIPDIAFMYMEMNNWQGMSVRCGVWQYYESGSFQKGKFERVMSFLKANGEEEMADVYASGIHDYANEKYQENYDYPEEWFDETERTDEWIGKNEEYIYKWMYDLILEHKSEVYKLILEGRNNMSKDLVPFWEKAYQEYDTVTFSIEPNITVTEFEHLMNNQSKVLDVGCGEGQNAIYLAKQGHLVDAFDLSEHGIAKLKHRCELSDTQVNAFSADLTTYQFEQYYDMIICFGTLHFVAKNEWEKFIKNAKKYTNIGGIHIIQIFTDTVPASEDIAPFAIGLAKDEELKELYTDWEILQFKSYVFEDEHPNVPKHLHASNKIVARRIK